MGENFEEIVSSPTVSVTFGSNTDFGALISAWEVESQAARDGQIVLRMAVTRPTVVLILDPVDRVPDGSVAESGSQEQSSVGGKVGIQIRFKCLGGRCEPCIHADGLS